MTNWSQRRNYLAKINANDAPAGIGVPTEPSEWEGQWFSTSHPQKTRIAPNSRRVNLPPEQIADPRPGDRLFIWVNEKKRGGRGLTAIAEIGDTSQAGSSINIEAINVRLFPDETLNNALVKAMSEQNGVFPTLSRSAVSKLRWITDEDARRLDELIRQHPEVDDTVNEIPTASVLPCVAVSSDFEGNLGQGFQMSTEERGAIERHAMTIAFKALRAEGWTVKDVSRSESYDLLCTRGTERAYVEVKGTKGGGKQVIMTKAEVKFARHHRQNMLLVVIFGIQISNDKDAVSAQGGTIEIYRAWAPACSQLTPTSYICSLG